MKANKLKNQSTIASMFGSKRDALVLRFVSNLKKAVFMRRQLTHLENSEKFIGDIMKQLEFNKIVNQAKPKAIQKHPFKGSNVDQIKTKIGKVLKKEVQ